jgi:hypothetical protein
MEHLVPLATAHGSAKLTFDKTPQEVLEWTDYFCGIFNNKESVAFFNNGNQLFNAGQGTNRCLKWE